MRGGMRICYVIRRRQGRVGSEVDGQFESFVLAFKY
jgi:hypothetical protein